MQARQAEAIKLQQPFLRGGSREKPNTSVGALLKDKSSKQSSHRFQKGSHTSGATASTTGSKQPGTSKTCYRCGKISCS